MKHALADDLFRLLSLEPGSRAAEKRRVELEHGVMRIVQSDGLRGVRRLVRALDAHRVFEPVFATGSVRAWRCEAGDTRLTLQVNTGRFIKSASISYSKRVVSQYGTRERARHALQQQFYARYGVVGPAGRLAPSRLSPADRLVRSIGDFEADLNNGGFGQYLGNKGRAQAARVLQQLRRIGARRTVALLGAALHQPTDGLDALDAAHARRPDDLASLVMRHLGRRRS